MQTRLLSQGWKQVKSAGVFMDLVGPLWARREREGVAAAWRYGLLLTPRHLNPAGVVHGGLLETLMDHALSAIAWEAAGRVPCVSVQLDSHFLSAARAGEFIEASGLVVHRSQSMVFLRGGLCVAERQVMAAQALMKIQQA
ncbi:PaaI family thioesterase [Variovorax sp. HJSM1_2]|uniref:PaaI family thioesterase n=1 Tax=Variovorax sp. HJSM1_2 TaxID=3366263 RepID=UPI003BECD60B